MSHAPSDIMYHALLKEGIITGPANNTWPGFIGVLPDFPEVPDNSIVITDTAGIKDGKLQKGEVLEKPGLQIVTRGVSYLDPFYKMEDIIVFVDSIKDLSVTVAPENTVYIIKNVIRVGTSIALDIDGKNKRHKFSLNLLLVI